MLAAEPKANKLARIRVADFILDFVVGLKAFGMIDSTKALNPPVAGAIASRRGAASRLQKPTSLGLHRPVAQTSGLLYRRPPACLRFDALGEQGNGPPRQMLRDLAELRYTVSVPLMSIQKSVSRRRFVGGLAALTGYCGLTPELNLWAQTHTEPVDVIERSRVPSDQYDSVAKLCFNENPFGPSPAVIEAMTHAFKYANRYGYPDGGLLEAIAATTASNPRTF